MLGFFFVQDPSREEATLVLPKTGALYHTWIAQRPTLVHILLYPAIVRNDVGLMKTAVSGT